MSKKWEDMTPRERDALVAEKVMGWRRREIRVGISTGDEIRTWMEAGIAFGIKTHVFNPEIERSDLPHYTTDISAAWEVVEKMRELVSLEVEFELFAYETGQWCATFGMDEGPDAPTAPEAICLAALRAKGVEV